MSIRKFTLKLFPTYFVMSILCFVIMISLFGFMEKNIFLGWLISLFIIAIFWYFTYAQVISFGHKDCDKNEYKPQKAFLAGGIIQVPAIIIYVIANMVPDQTQQLVEVLLRLYLSPYMGLFVIYEGLMPHLSLLVIALYPFGVMLSYMAGKQSYEKTMELIKRTEQDRLRKSKTDYEG